MSEREIASLVSAGAESDSFYFVRAHALLAAGWPMCNTLSQGTGGGPPFRRIVAVVVCFCLTHLRLCVWHLFAQVNNKLIMHNKAKYTYVDTNGASGSGAAAGKR